ncbi:MAG: MFS transporter [Myxococcales bacterium]|nr:MFS transporter [Myxococcales bacterium]
MKNPGDVRLSRREGVWLTLAATFTMTISYIDRQNVAVLAPIITRELQLSEVQYGVIASAFSLAYLVGAPFAGRYIDRVGARRGLLYAVVAWTVIAAAHALVPGFAALIAMRVLLGLAESPSFPGASQTVHRALSAEDRPRGIGVLFTGSSLGSMLAPPLALGVASHFGWRMALLVSSMAGLVWVPLWLLTAYRPRAQAALDAPPDEAPSVRVGEGYRDVEIAAPDARPVWQNPALQRALALIVASSPLIGFILTWNAKYLVRTFTLSPLAIARYLWIAPLVFDLGAIGFGDLAARRARAPGNPRGGSDPKLVGLATALAGAAAVGLRSADSPAIATVWASLLMLGGGGTYAMLTSDMLARVPARAVSAAGGLCASAQALAFVVSNVLIGRGVASSGSFRGVLVGLALCVVPGALAWHLWPGVPPVRDAA